MKTTLSLKSWHKKFKRLIKKKQPPFEYIIKKIKKNNVKLLYGDFLREVDTTTINREVLELAKVINVKFYKYYILNSVLDHLELLALYYLI